MNSIIKKIELNDGTTIECGDIILKVPNGYRVYSEKGILKELINKNGDLIGYDTISYRPVLIKSILKNHDTEDEKLLLKKVIYIQLAK